MPSDPLNQPALTLTYYPDGKLAGQHLVKPSRVLADLTDEQVDALAARMADTIDQPYFLHLNGEYVPEDPVEVFAHAIHNACRGGGS